MLTTLAVFSLSKDRALFLHDNGYNEELIKKTEVEVPWELREKTSIKFPFSGEL